MTLKRLFKSNHHSRVPQLFFLKQENYHRVALFKSPILFLPGRPIIITSVDDQVEKSRNESKPNQSKHSKRDRNRSSEGGSGGEWMEKKKIFFLNALSLSPSLSPGGCVVLLVCRRQTVHSRQSCIIVEVVAQRVLPQGEKRTSFALLRLLSVIFILFSVCNKTKQEREGTNRCAESDTGGGFDGSTTTSSFFLNQKLSISYMWCMQRLL